MNPAIWIVWVNGQGISSWGVQQAHHTFRPGPPSAQTSTH